MTTGPKRDCQCPQANHQHGTVVAYTRDACRCDQCRNAVRIARADERRQKAYGRYTKHHLDPTATREHLHALHRSGIPYRQISALSGVASSTIKLIAHGQGESVRPETQRRILAVQPTQKHAHNGTVIDGTGTSRRIKALITNGWTQAQLAQQLGMMPANLWTIIQNRQKVTVATAAKITALYEQLWNKSPQPQTPNQWRAYARAKRTAHSHGWLPALAWDEDRLDDPNHHGYPKEVAA